MRWLGLALAALVFSAPGMAFLLGSQFAVGSDTASVRIGSATVLPGGNVTVPLEVLNVPSPGPGALTVDIVYDASIEPTDWSAGADLDMVQCSLDYAPDTIRCTGIDAAGVSGAILAANITFHAVGQPGVCSALDVTVVTFTDPDGNPLPVIDEDGQICILPQESYTPMPTPTPTPTPTPGLNGDSGGISMVAGWNDKCYIGEQMGIEDALTGIEDKVLAMYILNPSGGFDRWFPDRPDVSTIDTLHPYDQLFVLMSEAVAWKQEQSAQTRASVNLVQGWNNVCYSGETRLVEEATVGITEAIGILYKLSDTEGWIRYVPNRPDLSEMSTLTELDSVLILVTEPTGATWVFSP